MFLTFPDHTIYQLYCIIPFPGSYIYIYIVYSLHTPIPQRKKDRHLLVTYYLDFRMGQGRVESFAVMTIYRCSKTRLKAKPKDQYAVIDELGIDVSSSQLCGSIGDVRYVAKIRLKTSIVMFQIWYNKFAEPFSHKVKHSLNWNNVEG